MPTLQDYAYYDSASNQWIARDPNTYTVKQEGNDIVVQTKAESYKVYEDPLKRGTPHADVQTGTYSKKRLRFSSAGNLKREEFYDLYTKEKGRTAYRESPYLRLVKEYTDKGVSETKTVLQKRTTAGGRVRVKPIEERRFYERQEQEARRIAEGRKPGETQASAQARRLRQEQARVAAQRRERIGKDRQKQFEEDVLRTQEYLGVSGKEAAALVRAAERRGERVAISRADIVRARAQRQPATNAYEVRTQFLGRRPGQETIPTKKAIREPVSQPQSFAESIFPYQAAVGSQVRQIGRGRVDVERVSASPFAQREDVLFTPISYTERPAGELGTVLYTGRVRNQDVALLRTPAGAQRLINLPIVDDRVEESEYQPLIRAGGRLKIQETPSGKASVRVESAPGYRITETETEQTITPIEFRPFVPAAQTRLGGTLRRLGQRIQTSQQGVTPVAEVTQGRSYVPIIFKPKTTLKGRSDIAEQVLGQSLKGTSNVVEDARRRPIRTAATLGVTYAAGAALGAGSTAIRLGTATRGTKVATGAGIVGASLLTGLGVGAVGAEVITAPKGERIERGVQRGIEFGALGVAGVRGARFGGRVRAGQDLRATGTTKVVDETFTTDAELRVGKLTGRARGTGTPQERQLQGVLGGERFRITEQAGRTTVESARGRQPLRVVERFKTPKTRIEAQRTGEKVTEYEDFALNRVRGAIAETTFKLRGASRRGITVYDTTGTGKVTETTGIPKAATSVKTRTRTQTVTEEYRPVTEEPLPISTQRRGRVDFEVRGRPAKAKDIFQRAEESPQSKDISPPPKPAKATVDYTKTEYNIVRRGLGKESSYSLERSRYKGDELVEFKELGRVPTVERAASRIQERLGRFGKRGEVGVRRVGEDPLVRFRERLGRGSRARESPAERIRSRARGARARGGGLTEGELSGITRVGGRFGSRNVFVSGSGVRPTEDTLSPILTRSGVTSLARTGIGGTTPELGPEDLTKSTPDIFTTPDTFSGYTSTPKGDTGATPRTALTPALAPPAGVTGFSFFPPLAPGFTRFPGFPPIPRSPTPGGLPFQFPRFRNVFKQVTAYTPTATAAAFNIRGPRESRLGSITGLSFRPLPEERPKKRKRRGRTARK